MSLVNDMLRDLEQRRAGEEQALDGLHAVADAAPTERVHRGAWIAVLGGIGVAAALAIVAWPDSDDTAPQIHALSPTALAAPGPQPDTDPDRRSMRLVTTPLVTNESTTAHLTRYRMSYALARAPVARPATRRPSVARVAAPTARTEAAQPADPPAALADAQTQSADTDPAPAAASAASDQPSLSKVAADPRANWRRDGLRALRADRPGEAAELFRRIVRHDPADTEAHLLLHRALQAQRRPDHAQLALFAALETAHEPARVAVVLGHELLGAGDAATARRVLEQYRPAAFDDLAYEGLLAAAYERSGAPGEALAQYEALATLDPGNGAWWIGVGIANEALGRPDAALAAFRRAGTTRLDPALAQYARERIATLEAGT